MKRRLPLSGTLVYKRRLSNWAVIGDRDGDRLTTTYHRSVSTFCKGFQKGGDRLKENLHFSLCRE